MNLVICMAGLNTRFHDVGFDLPKYLLPWGEKTVIHSILSNLKKSYDFGRVILLPNKRDRFFKDELVSALDGLDIKGEDISYIGDTIGQAHTAALGAEIVGHFDGAREQPIAFHNSDTIIQNRDFVENFEKLKTNDAFIDVFPASSVEYSYVSLANGRVTRVAEKNIISPFASSGFYAFRTLDVYLNAFNALHSTRTEGSKSEIFVTDVLADMVRADNKVFVNDFGPESNTIVLGTPQEYGIELARVMLKESF